MRYMPHPSPRLLVWLLGLTVFFTAFNATLAAGTCGEEPASTTLTTSLSGEAKSGEEITVNEGAKVKDQASLSGKNAATATGTIKYFVYSDSKCESLVTKAGETGFSEGKVPASEEKTLEAGAVYYWRAEYTGDAKNAASKSTCGKEVLTVKAMVSISTVLAGLDAEGETVEGGEISVPAGTAVIDTATLSGTNASKATGTLQYLVYSDEECEELVAEAGEVEVKGTAVPPSEEQPLEEGTFYWQAVYSGDSLHKESISTCGDEIARAIAPTSLATELAGEGEEGAEIEVTEGTAVSDSAELTGKNASKATGNVEYSVYSDVSCEELVTKAGKVTVGGESVPASTPQTLEPGIYFWMAEYSGDSANYESRGPCGSEILVVTPRITTELTGENAPARKSRSPKGPSSATARRCMAAKPPKRRGRWNISSTPTKNAKNSSPKREKSKSKGPRPRHPKNWNSNRAPTTGWPNTRATKKIRRRRAPAARSFSSSSPRPH